MRAVIDPRTERVLTEAGAGIARVLDACRRHAVVLAVDVVWYIVAALPPDGSVTFGDVVRLLRWFARGFNDGVEVDDGDE
jgi:hypothetical protein